MLTTSETWKALAASGTARLETKAIIDGKEYLQMTAPKINRATMQGGLSIGNVVSATCSFSILTADVIPRAAKVTIKMRLTDDESYSEWLPAGTFFISHREHDKVNNILTLDCYDALLKANADFATVPWTDDLGNFIKTNAGEFIYFPAVYPCTMQEMAQQIAELLELEIDERTVIATGDIYVIERPDGTVQVRDMLSKIAAANGGNWIVTPENRLRLVPIISASGASSATENVVDVLAALGTVSATISAPITGVRIQVDSGTQVIGNENGIVLDADLSPVLAAALLAKVAGIVYQPFNLPQSIYDPAVELGDYVRHEMVSGVLYSEQANMGLAFRGDITAPDADEIADEYPYIGVTSQAIKLLSENVSLLDESVTEAKEAADAAQETANNAVLDTEVKTQYYLSDSDDELTGGEWSDSTPSWETGKYVWTRVVTTVIPVVGEPTINYSQEVYDENITTALSTSEEAQGTAHYVQNVVEQNVINYMHFEDDGLHIGNKNETSELVADSFGVSVHTYGSYDSYSRFAADYVQFGDYQLRRSADGGLVFKREGV